jgi:hypothetical protein
MLSSMMLLFGWRHFDYFSVVELKAPALGIWQLLEFRKRYRARDRDRHKNSYPIIRT